MDLTRLLPNKTLMWKEWKNNSILIAVFAAIVSYYSTYNLIRAIFLHDKAIEQGLYNRMGEDFYSYLLINLGDFLSFQSYSNAGASLVLIFFTVVLGAFMIGRERDHKTYDLLLGLPYSRFDIIHNKFILGLSQLVAIFVLNAAMMSLLVLANSKINLPFGLGEIWSWAGVNMIVLGFIFAFTMFISSLSGTTLGNVLLSYIFVFFPAGIMSLVALNFDFWDLFEFVYRYDGVFQSLGELIMALTAPLYLMGFELVGESYRPSGYIVMFLLVFVLYYFTQRLFAKNRLENNGEVLMFEETEGVFKVGVVACFTLLLGPIFLYILGVERIAHWLFLAVMVYVFAGAIVWFFVNWLIKSRKTV